MMCSRGTFRSPIEYSIVILALQTYTYKWKDLERSIRGDLRSSMPLARPNNAFCAKQGLTLWQPSMLGVVLTLSFHKVGPHTDFLLGTVDTCNYIRVRIWVMERTLENYLFCLYRHIAYSGKILLTDFGPSLFLLVVVVHFCSRQESKRLRIDFCHSIFEFLNDVQFSLDMEVLKLDEVANNLRHSS